MTTDHLATLASTEAEQSVLGAILLDNGAFDAVWGTLETADFHRSEHRLIYEALGRQINSCKGADVVSTFELLKAEHEEADFGGLSYLHALSTSVVSAARVRRHADIVREKSKLREVLAKLDEASEIARGAGDLPSKLDSIAALLNGIDAGNSARAPKPMSDVMIRVIDGINAAADGSAPPGWPTGFPTLDRLHNGGIRPGKVYVLAARPSVGKSSVSWQILEQNAEAGRPCLDLNQEMEDEEIGQRALANTGRIDYGRIQTGQLTTEEWGRVAEGVDKLGNAPIWIDDEPSLNLRAINSKARYVRGLKVLLVDYLQLCEGEGETRSAAVGSVSRGLKKLAKQLGIAVILLSQLNRKVDERPDKRPQMSDLRDSGEIEQDADAIWFMWPLDNELDAEVRSVGFEVAKNRGGKKGAFVMNFEGSRQRWTESTRRLDEFQRSKARTGGFE
jgi:replicative DNA helicase